MQIEVATGFDVKNNCEVLEKIEIKDAQAEEIITELLENLSYCEIRSFIKSHDIVTVQ